MGNTSKKFIIITSIFAPTEAVKQFAKRTDWKLIVVGDKKSPANWECANVIYLSSEHQMSLGYNILKLLPWNHYCRKMVGYLYAIQNGADIIVDTDDDNIPYKDWDILPFSGKYNTLSNDSFVNIYSYYTNEFIWPRGFPLNHILNQNKAKGSVNECQIGVWQFLADGDPDVDAIYRLTNNKPVFFNKNAPVVLRENSLCPFNSQNTAFRKELFPLLYLPAFVTFRFTDILRGLIAQPLLWNMGFNLGFSNATVVQERNPHNYLTDFESEIPVYMYSEKVIELTKSSISKDNNIYENILATYKTLFNHKIVCCKELELVQLWINDLKQILNRD